MTTSKPTTAEEAIRAWALSMGTRIAESLHLGALYELVKAREAAARAEGFAAGLKNVRLQCDQLDGTYSGPSYDDGSGSCGFNAALCEIDKFCEGLLPPTPDQGSVG